MFDIDLSQIDCLVLKSLWCTCLTKHHSTAICLFCCQGLSDEGCAAALQSGRHVHMTSIRCWFSQPNQVSTDYDVWHTGSLTVSQHAQKASTPGGAQFESFSLSQGPPPEQELHEWSQSSLYRYPWRVPVASRNRLPSVKKVKTSWPENMGERLCVFMAPLFGQEAALHVSRVPNWTPGEAVENKFNAACGFILLYCVRGRFFLDCHELSVVP